MTLSLPWPRRRTAAADASSNARVRGGLRLRRIDSTLALVGLAVYLGLLVRLQHLLAAGGFPINDGGMFYSMIEDVRRAGYALPQYTSYNGGDIPFAYSPLPFYLGASLVDVFGLSTLDVLRFVPLIASVATIPAAYILARALLPERSIALLATFLFALTPRAYSWEIAGGGLTRALGFLFFTLAFYQLYRLAREPGPGRTAVATLLVSLTLLCHMEMAWMLAWSYALVLAVYGRSRAALACAGCVALGAALLTAPWWGQVIANHGIEPYLAAMQTGNHSLVAPLRLLFFNYTDEAFFPVVAALGVIGIGAALASRQYLLPAWLLLMFLVDPRKAPTYAMLPLVLLAGYALQAVIRPQLERLWEGGGVSGGRTPRWLAALPALVLVYLLITSPGTTLGRLSPLQSLSRDEVDAMHWAAENTPADSRFLVISGVKRGPWLEPRTEWFPALSRRRSVATPQGTEWLPGTRGMNAAIDRYDALQTCADSDAACLAEWASTAGAGYSHVYVSKAPRDGAKAAGMIRPARRDCCAALRSSLAKSPDFALVFEGETVQIYALRRPAAASGSGTGRDGTAGE